jgi:hypothetical protein
VPDVESGNYISDFNSAFATEIKTVVDGNIGIDLAETPVYVEEYE